MNKMNPKIQEESPISLYDLRKEMKKIKKRDTELSLRSGKTEEYLNQFAVLKDKDAESLEKELAEMEIPRFKDSHIKKVIDTLPESVEELKVVLQGYTLTISKENMQKIVSAVKKYEPEIKS
jgi:DNA-directed RNA polymerase subunit F